MKLELFENPPEPSLPRAQPVRMLWYEDWWDGPLSGRCEWDGERYWFHFFKDDDGPDPQRWFWIFQLTQEQQRDVEYRHRRFQELMGNGTDFVDDPEVVGGRRLGNASPADPERLAAWNRECGEGLQIAELNERQIVAWFKEEDTKGTGAIPVFLPKS